MSSPTVPIPRCCRREDHCTNNIDEDYGRSILSSLTSIYNHTKEYLRNSKTRHLNFSTMNPMWTLAGEERLATRELLEQLEDMWGDDPVHMAGEGYFRLAAGILKEIQVKSIKTAAGVGKRPREDSEPGNGAGNSLTKPARLNWGQGRGRGRGLGWRGQA